MLNESAVKRAAQEAQIMINSGLPSIAATDILKAAKQWGF
jgi:hypothetical protein